MLGGVVSGLPTSSLGRWMNTTPPDTPNPTAGSVMMLTIGMKP